MEHNWVLVDTETDGLDAPIHAVEIAAQRFYDKHPIGEPFRVFLNHGIPIPIEAQAVHGYTEEFLKTNGIEPVRAYKNFWEYVAGARVVAHFAQYDWKRVLLPESERLGVRVNGELGFCSWKLAKRSLPDHPTWKLDYLREVYSLQSGIAHTALGDIEATADLITRIIFPKLSRYGIVSAPELAGFSNIPVKLCHLILKEDECLSPEIALEKALQKIEVAARADKARKQLEDFRAESVHSCDECDLQNLAASYGFFGEAKDISFTGKSFVFTGTLMACKRKEAIVEVIKRDGTATESWPPDYLVLGAAAPGGGGLRSAILTRIKGEAKPLIVSEEDFLFSLQEYSDLEMPGASAQLMIKNFTPHKPTVRTSAYIESQIKWRRST